MKIKVVEYATYLATDARRRHYHRHISKWVIEFAIQLEVRIEDRWLPVVRYDTAHGCAHRDLIHPDGQKEKATLDINSFNDALTFGENDIKINWPMYKERFLKEVK